LMRLYPLLPETPVNVILEFGALRKRILAPAKTFRTPEDFRAWVVQNCVVTQGTPMQHKPTRLEIYDEAAAAFVLFCDLQTVIEDAWFRLTFVDYDDDKAGARARTAASLGLSHSPPLHAAPAAGVMPSPVAVATTRRFTTISKSELRFTDGETELMPIQQEVTDSFTVTSKAPRPVAFAIAALADETPKFKLTIRPAEGHLRSGESVTIIVTLVATCTTTIAFDIAVTVECPGEEESREVTTLALTAITHTTHRIDYDEIKLVRPAVGSGASGVVCRGFYRGQEIACKVLHLQEDVATFEREVETLEKLRSPYVVTFIGASHLPKKLCIATEFLTLGSVLSAMQRKKFSWPLKLKCLLDCARGMCFLHGSGIMHRDLSLHLLLSKKTHFFSHRRRWVIHLEPDNLMLVTMSVDSPVCCKITGETSLFSLSLS